eukprot:NODE_339_length_10647_cov_0.388320.p2 type:complete len:458 gc:universal NODE_339_length_10647_cov_0.388320:9463-8090(-)
MKSLDWSDEEMMDEFESFDEQSDADEPEFDVPVKLDEISSKQEAEDANDTEVIDASILKDDPFLSNDIGQSELKVERILVDDINHKELFQAESDPKTVKQKIHAILTILEDYKQLKDTMYTRQEYIDQLRLSLQAFYGYNDFLLQKLWDMFPSFEILACIESNEIQRPLTIRTNTLKIKRRELTKLLLKRGMQIRELPGEWTNLGLQIMKSKVPVGATPEYLNGYYMIQSASSWLPVMAMAEHANLEEKRILDMCAAPGGKTTYLAQLMKNSGILFANDINKLRCKAVAAMLSRMGVENCIVCNEDGRELDKKWINMFDGVLLDAPCSGTGVISKDPQVKHSKNENEIRLLSDLQKQLLLSAIDACKVGGIVVYSTCSILIDENECVVNYSLKKRDVKLVPCEINVGKPGYVNFKQMQFNKTLQFSKRIYAHTHNMDGFYFAKLVKMSNKKNDQKRE